MDIVALQQFIKDALAEDLGSGDHSSLACIPEDKISKARLLVKDKGILAGVKVAKEIFFHFDSNIEFVQFLEDGVKVNGGEVAFEVTGNAVSILSCERFVLNCMQRMSGIATYTNFLTSKIKHTEAKLLDTRKTTPNFRLLEKEAVKIGGGVNHRFGLYDMIMLKDNHIDYAGGISAAVQRVRDYLVSKSMSLDIEVEVRDFDELHEAMQQKGIRRIMLDNFTPSDMKEAVELIDGKFETEASGGITEDDIANYAETGVDYISVGALTHQIKSLDLSLKAC